VRNDKTIGWYHKNVILHIKPKVEMSTPMVYILISRAIFFCRSYILQILDQNNSFVVRLVISSDIIIFLLSMLLKGQCHEILSLSVELFLLERNFDSPRIMDLWTRFVEDIKSNRKPIFFTGVSLYFYLHSRKSIFLYACEQMLLSVLIQNVGGRKDPPLCRMGLRGQCQLIYERPWLTGLKPAQLVDTGNTQTTGYFSFFLSWFNWYPYEDVQYNSIGCNKTLVTNIGKLSYAIR
jgi:hypothetical protein